MATIAQVEAQREKLTAQLAGTTDVDKVNALVEKLWSLARQDGIDDLVIDLWESEDISKGGVEFAVTSYGACDPR